MAPTKLSEIKTSSIFFFPDEEEAWPMYVGTFKYPGKLHPETVVKNLFEQNPCLQSMFNDWDDYDECDFMVFHDTFGISHHKKTIDYNDANVHISAGELRGKEIKYED